LMADRKQISRPLDSGHMQSKVLLLAFERVVIISISRNFIQFREIFWSIFSTILSAMEKTVGHPGLLVEVFPDWLLWTQTNRTYERRHSVELKFDGNLSPCPGYFLTSSQANHIWFRNIAFSIFIQSISFRYSLLIGTKRRQFFPRFCSSNQGSHSMSNKWKVNRQPRSQIALALYLVWWVNKLINHKLFLKRHQTRQIP
jgi:hypothetical protein